MASGPRSFLGEGVLQLLVPSPFLEGEELSGPRTKILPSPSPSQNQDRVPPPGQESPLLLFPPPPPGTAHTAGRICRERTSLAVTQADVLVLAKWSGLGNFSLLT